MKKIRILAGKRRARAGARSGKSQLRSEGRWVPKEEREQAKTTSLEVGETWAGFLLL